jgi:hypothetical protein
MRQQKTRRLQATLLSTVEKRDRVGQFMAHLEAQIASALEVTRLKARPAG